MSLTYLYGAPGFGVAELARRRAQETGAVAYEVTERADGGEFARLRSESVGVVVHADVPPSPELSTSIHTVLGPRDLKLSVEALEKRLGEESAVGQREVRNREAAERTHAVTGGWPSLVDVAVDTMSEGVDTALRVAQSAVPESTVRWAREQWPGLIEHLGVAGTASLREIEECGWSGHVESLLEYAMVTSIKLHGEACLKVVPAVGAAVLRTLTADDITGVRQRIATTRDRLGVLDCGLTDAYEIGDLRWCAQILDRWSLRFSYTGYRALSQRILLSLPPAALQGLPTASLRAEYLGALPVGTTPVHLPVTAEQRRAIHRAGRSAVVLSRVFYAMVARRNHGRAIDARRLAAAALPLAEDTLRAEDSDAVGLASFWYLQAAISSLMAADVADARRLLRTAWRYQRNDQFGFAAHDTAAKMALLSAWVGDGPTLELWCVRADACSDDSAAHGQVRRWIDRCVDVARLSAALDRLDLPSAEQHAVRLGEYADREEMWPFVLWARVRRGLMLGRARQVLELIEDTRYSFPTTADADGLHSPLVATLRAEANLALGRGTEAAVALQGVPESSPLRRVPLVRLRLLSGQWRDAEELAADFMAREDTTARDRTELAVLQAAARYRRDDRAGAAQACRWGAEQARAHRHEAVFCAIPRNVVDDLSATELQGCADLDVILALLDAAELAPAYPEHIALVELTERESVVLSKIAAGGTLERIAEELFVSVNTVKSQRRSVYRKLGASSRSAAVARARVLGVLRDGPTDSQIV